MTYTQKRHAIVLDYKNGMSIEEIAEKYNHKPYLIERFVKAKKYQIDVDHFNVNEYDCWIMPTRNIIESHKNQD